MRMTVVRTTLAWLALSVAGGIVIAMPDDGSRVFTISETHGPSAVDLAGIFLLLLGWAIFLVALWRVRDAIAHRPVLAVIVAAGAGVIAWSVLTDSGMWWMLGAAALAGVQIWAALSAVSRLSQPERIRKAR